MAGYNGMILTKAGLQLQAQAQIGGELRITKIAIGDGMLASGENIEDLTALKHQVMTLGIQDMEVTDDGQSRIRALITNDNLNTGFFVREVGVFAKIGDAGAETLYSYTNANDKADYLPNKGLNVVEEVLEVYVIVGNAQNVTCNINDRVTLATKQDLNDHTKNTNNPHNTVASQISNDLINGLTTTDVQSTLAAIFSEAKKKSGSVRNVVLTGPLSAKGVANLLRDRYSENLCYGGATIDSGSYGGLYPASYAFDDTASTWVSLQTGAGITGVSYIGYQFSTAKKIRKIILQNHVDGVTTGALTSVKIQSSTDGATWNTIATVSIVAAANYRNIISVPDSTAAPYWRLLANSGVTPVVGDSWKVQEIKMYELLDSSLTDSDLVVQSGGVINFAAGMNAFGLLDYMYSIGANASLTLTAADAQTIPLSYTEDLCNGGTPISGGDYASYPVSQAFDNNTATYWASAQTGTAAANTACIGYNFGVAKAIRKIMINSNIVQSCKSLYVQFSNDGTTWTNLPVVNIGFNSINYLYVPAVGAFKYWRVVASVGVTDGAGSSINYAWTVNEIEMYEALQTHYIYATRDANGNVTAGSTRNKPRTVKPVTAATTTPGYYTNDLCNGGTAISGGDNTTLVKENAFDNNLSTNWGSSQIAANQSGVAYVGYDFGVGVAKTIRKLSVAQHPATVKWMPSVKVQYSDNGTVWTDAITTAETSNQATAGITFPNCGSHRYWRILANGNITTSQTWDIYEIEMYEYVDPSTSTTQADDTTYSDNLCVGGGFGASSTYSTNLVQYTFDKNPLTLWESNNPGGSGDFVFYDFGVSRHVRKIVLDHTMVDGLHYMPSVKVQRSTDGTTWNDVYTANGLTSGVNNIYLPASTSSRYWRVLANAQTSGGATFLWCITELSMYEISNDVNMYDPIAGVSKHYDGSTWDTVVRKFLGEAVVDSAGKIVSYTTYDYGKTKLKALAAEDSDDVLTLGQITASLLTNGWAKLPVMVNGVKTEFIIQWGFINTHAGDVVTALPIAFPVMGLVVIASTGYTAGSSVVGTVTASFSSRSTITSYHSNSALGAMFICIGI